MKARQLASLAILAAAGGCLPLPASVRGPTEIWGVWAPLSDSTAGTGGTAGLPRSPMTAGLSTVIDTWIALDTASFRPVLLAQMRGERPVRHFAVVTSFQGTRFHPEVVRGMSESRDAVSAAAGSIVSVLAASAVDGLLLDFQEMAPQDLQTLVDVSRVIADSARAHSANSVGIIIPAADSAAYPARTLGRIADVLVVRLFPEHGAGNPAGPIVSPSWFVRRLGARAGEVGVNRIVAGIPADGIVWSRGGVARRVSHTEALRLAAAADAAVVRDPASGNLHASSSRDGWDLWVSDHQLIEKLIAEGRRIGVTRFALFGLDGADPELWQLLPQLIK
jgi:spore germination protein YaaH